MPKPSLNVTVRDTTISINRLENFRNEFRSFAPVHQYMFAELIMLRMFSILENAIEDIACKLVAGSPYTSGKYPVRLFAARSMECARSAMRQHGRTKTLNNLRWTSSGDIRESTKTVLDQKDPFITNVQIHANALDEMRKVRNFLAHRSTQSRMGYRQVVRVVYGANSRVRVEAFLTSRQRRSTAKIDEYLATSKIIILDLAKG